MNDGGPAFPVYLPKGIEGNFTAPGMALRDYFAAQTLSGMIARPTPYSGDVDDLAQFAYQWADALIKARNYPPPP